jgi:Putative transposase
MERSIGCRRKVNAFYACPCELNEGRTRRTLLACRRCRRECALNAEKNSSRFTRTHLASGDGNRRPVRCKPSAASSCCHLQPSAAFRLRFPGPFSLEGLCPRQQQGTMTLTSREFLRRFAQHVLPRCFPRIRYFGWLSNRRRTRTLPLCRVRLNQAPPLKSLLSQHRLYGTARTAMGSCAASNRSPPLNSSLRNEGSSMPLTPHKSWSTAAPIACLPTHPLHLRLQTEHSLPTGRHPSVRINVFPSSAPSHTPSTPIGRRCHLTQPASPMPQTIQTP